VGTVSCAAVRPGSVSHNFLSHAATERKSPNCRSLGNPSPIPGIPLYSHSAPRFLSQPSHAPLTNTPIGAFHLQPCQTYKGSNSLLGVQISDCHQHRQTSCQRDGCKKHRIQTCIFIKRYFRCSQRCCRRLSRLTQIVTGVSKALSASIFRIRQ